MYNIIVTEKFQKDIDYYKKKRKYKHIDLDVQNIVGKLVTGDLVGSKIPRIIFKG